MIDSAMVELSHTCPEWSRGKSVHSGYDYCLACDVAALHSLAAAHPNHNKKSRDEMDKCVERLTVALLDRAHLQEASRLLFESSGDVETGDWPRLDAWLAAERARRSQ